MAELDFIIYRTDQDASLSKGNEECARKATLTLVYDDDGARGDYGRVQTVIVNPDMIYEQVFLKYNTSFDWITGGEVTLDGIELLDGDHVYLAGQTISLEDGIYIVRAGTWDFYKSVTDDVFIDLGARAVDEVDGDLSREILTYKPDLDFSEVGFYSIHYYVVNSIGVLSSKFRKVKVIKLGASIVATGSFKISDYEIISEFDSELVR